MVFVLQAVLVLPNHTSCRPFGKSEWDAFVETVRVLEAEGSVHSLHLLQRVNRPGITGGAVLDR